MKNYRAEFHKDPFDVTLDLETLKNAIYLIEGDVSAKNWQNVAKMVDSGKGGGCHVRLEVKKEHQFITITGTIEFTLMRTCNRTLEPFLLTQQAEVDERLSTDEKYISDEVDLLESHILNIGEYLEQQIIINLDPYPIHPNTLTTGRGEFGLSDNIKEEKNKENQFSVLKQLKN